MDAVLDGDRFGVTASTSMGAEADVGILARRGAVNVLGAGGSAVLNFLLVVAVTRTLPPDEAGTFFAVTSLFLLLVALARLGSGTGLVYFIARFRALGRPDLISDCVRIALGPVFLLSALLAAVLLLAADPVAEALVRGDPGDAAGNLRIVAVFLPFAALLEGVLGATRGFGRMEPTVVLEKFLRPAAQLAGVVVVASAGTGAVVLAWSLPYLPVLLAGSGWLLVLRRREPPATPEPDDTRSRLRRDYWSFTLPRAVSALVQVALQRVDVILVTALLGPGQAALYVVSTRLLVLGAFAIQAVSMAVLPQAVGHYTLGQRQALSELYRTSTTWLVLMTWPLYLLGLLFAPTVLRLFGPGYDEGARVLVILSLATMFSTACGLVDVMLTMAGRTSWILGNVCVALTVNVVLNLVLIPAVGIEGAAWAWAAAIAVNNLLPLGQLWFSLRMQPFGRSVAEAVAVNLVAWVLPGVLLVVVLGQGVSAVVGCVIVGGVTYLALLWVRRRVLALDELLRALRPRSGRGPTGAQR